MAYINAFSAHIWAVQQWGAAAAASLHVDLGDFGLEVKCRGRYFHFRPQFFSHGGGRMGNTDAITTETGGFAGWLPYRPYTFELSTDKLRFKQFCLEAGLPTPAHWLLDGDARPAHDYVLKRSAGSFGLELAGPYPAGTRAADQQLPPGQERGRAYAEQFMRGRILKLWCWGARPFFAHLQDWPQVQGDGRSSAGELVGRRLRAVGIDFDPAGEHAATLHCLRVQGLAPEDVPPDGREVFIDYRYGRQYQPLPRGLASDDALALCPPAARAAFDQAAAAVSAALRKRLAAPVLYALDGVLDEQGRVWWLEVNSNPTLPPEGYAQMFGDLFGA